MYHFQLFCQPNKPFRDEICKSWSMDYCIPQYNTDTNNTLEHLNVSLSQIITDLVNCKYYIVIRIKHCLGM